MIAMALALQPQILIMDEPTTALDVVTQRQILKRIAELQTELHFAMVFITHDLSLLLEIADVIAVMYAGELVEVGRTQAIYKVPAHPYTAGLLASSPPLRGPRRTLTGIPGLPPDLHRSIAGCPFASRCSRRMDRCDVERPTLVRLRSEDPRYGEQSVACWLHTDAAPDIPPVAFAPSPQEGPAAGAEGERGT
jgi:peptide/nickel transport system ATP-binding protein